jgi:biotin synthase
MNAPEILSYLTGCKRDKDLFQRADEIRKKYCGEKVHIRGIIEFSNHCRRNCAYCGLRRDNQKISRYRMSPEEIVSLALQIAGLGVGTIVLQSGDDFWYKRDIIASIIRQIKKQADVAITLSLGERPLDHYRLWREAGADRYLMRHETMNPGLYYRLHQGVPLKTRTGLIVQLKKMGYEIGVGNMVGLPGQEISDLVKDILFIKQLGADMAGIGPFIPQKDTPLAGFPSGSLESALKVLALIRITSRNIHLPATTAVATLDTENGLVSALKAGANVIMPDFTPPPYSQNYQIYSHKARVTLKKAKEAIMLADRKIGKGKGPSLKNDSSLMCPNRYPESPEKMNHDRREINAC